MIALQVAATLSVLVMVASVASAQVPAADPFEPYKAPTTVPADHWSQDELAALMRELADVVIEHHVVRDPESPTFGMVYEFWEQDGRQVQQFGLDAMHDGSWLMTALIDAHRSDPDGGYLDDAQTYLVPFYTTMLNHSDVIFPDMVGRPNLNTKKPLTEPIKGWAPRGWDDGRGFDLAGRSYASSTFAHADQAQRLERDGAFAYTYFTSSNHLMQDLADGLANVWLTTRDPAVAEAITHIHAQRTAHFESIPVIKAAHDVVNTPADEIHFRDLGEFNPQNWFSFYTGAYQMKRHPITSYSDSQMWKTQEMINEAALTGQIHLESMLVSAAMPYGHQRSMEWYMVSDDYQIGLHPFDIQAPVFYTEKVGKLTGYYPDHKILFGARGVSFAAMAAAVLPALAEDPGVWEQHYHEAHANDTLVRVVDQTPAIDGKLDNVYQHSQTLAVGGVEVRAIADPHSLTLAVTMARPEVTIEITPADMVVGEPGRAVLTFTKDGVKAVNAQGEPMLVAASRAGSTVEVRLLSTVMPGQVRWANVIDHGRYRVSVDSETAGTLYVLSSPEHFLERVEAIITGNIDYYQRYFQAHGTLPSGYELDWDAGNPWQRSDSGNYAHLIRTLAYWSMHRRGTPVWEVIRAQAPDRPLEAKPLPRSTRQALGLE